MSAEGHSPGCLCRYEEGDSVYRKLVVQVLWLKLEALRFPSPSGHSNKAVVSSALYAWGQKIPEGLLQMSPRGLPFEQASALSLLKEQDLAPAADGMFQAQLQLHSALLHCYFPSRSACHHDINKNLPLRQPKKDCTLVGQG